MVNEDLKVEKLWQPCFLSDIESIVNRKIFSATSNCYQYGLRKNISYNLQYLEFICKHCFKEIRLTTVLEKQNYKMFIVVSASIIEGILYHEIRKNGLFGGGWKLFKIFKTNPLLFRDKEVKIENHYFEKADNVEDAEMKFDQMLKISEKHKLLGNNHDIYGKIKILKGLRNKIHIHLTKDNLDTDYNSFDEKKFNLAKSTLLAILKDYFNITNEEVDKYFAYLI